MSPLPPLLICTQADATIGAGHLLRCIALAQAWQDVGGEICFVTNTLANALQLRLKAEGMRAQEVEGFEAKSITALAHEIEARWVIVDGPNFSVDLIESLQSAGLRVLVLNDGLNSVPNADIVLNPNYGAEHTVYGQSDAVMLLGAPYILLRREFTAWAEKRFESPDSSSATCPQILVTLGGSDPENVTTLLATLLASARWLMNVRFVVGPSNPHRKSLEEAVGNSSNFEVVVAPSSMVSLMRWADLALICGGGTLWELMFLGCPVFSFARNQVQVRILRELEELGAIRCAGDLRFDPDEFSYDLVSLLNNTEQLQSMRRIGQTIVDGAGARRVVTVLQSL